MSDIRVEFVPIKVWNLGLFGFDHLQLVLEQAPGIEQDHWYVMEGLRNDRDPEGRVLLAVLGANGITTLVEGNTPPDHPPVTGPELVAEIGTPETRGTRILPGDGLLDWLQMSNLAQEIDAARLPYKAFAFASSAYPTLNSSSVVASLMWSVGIDPAQHMPFGMRMSPGTKTLIGSRNDDHMRIEASFNTLVGSHGDDLLEGSDNLSRIDKLYGGRDDDTIVHSKGFNIIHGGLFDLDYVEDGLDTVDYSGVGVVRIERNPYALEHFAPDYFVDHEQGFDWLFSIERIEWNPTNDRVILGPGVELVEDGLLLRMGEQSTGDQGDVLELAEIEGGLLVNAAPEGAHFIQAESRIDESGGLWVESVEWIVASAGDDRIYGGEGVRGLEGGEGNDLVDARLVAPFSEASPLGYDVELDGGIGDDTLVSGAGRTLMRGGEGSDTFILSAMTGDGGMVEIVIEDADPGDRLLVPHNFFNGSEAGFEGSQLLPVLGAQGTFDNLRDGDPLYFQWLLESHLIAGLDYVNGVIPFIGAIEFTYEDGDLLIHLYLGDSFYSTTEIDDAGTTITYLDNVFFPETETIVRVVDFSEGDLGIQFHDLGESTSIDLGNGWSFAHYDGYDAMVQTLTSNGVLVEPLAERPEAPQSNPNEGPESGGTRQPPPLVLGTGGGDTITLSQAGHVQGGEGNDIVDGSAAADIIDGGAGEDVMRGGRGNDRYIVESSGDVVLELSGEGSDTVTSSIDFSLPTHVENLTLAGAAFQGLGNDLANRIVGNDGDNRLVGGDGDDTLTGGLGDDVLIGGAGSDGYVVQADEGRDRIVDHGGEGLDGLLLVGGITPESITFFRPASDTDDLVLALSTGGRVVIDGFMSGSGIEEVLFEGGTIWSRGDLEGYAADAPILGNDAPHARDDLYVVLRSMSGVVGAEVLLANDTDYDGDELSIVAVADAIGADVTLDGNGDVMVSKHSHHQGLVSFTYTVSDGDGGLATALVEMAIEPNAAPAANGTIATQVVTPDEEWSLLLPDGLFTDADGDRLYYSASLAGGAALPDWLAFDAQALSFEGAIPAGLASAITIEVAAFDGIDRTTLSFDLTPAADPPPGGGATRGDDVIIGTDLADTIAARAGNDILRGRGGDDVLLGQAGDDELDGGAGNDILRGARDADTLLGGLGDDQLFGGRGADALSGGSGADLLRGGEGDDMLGGGAGDDLLFGGLGVDTAVFSGLMSEFTIVQATRRKVVVEHQDGGGVEGTDTLVGIERLQFDDGIIDL